MRGYALLNVDRGWLDKETASQSVRETHTVAYESTADKTVTRSSRKPVRRPEGRSRAHRGMNADEQWHFRSGVAARRKGPGI